MDNQLPIYIVGLQLYIWSMTYSILCLADQRQRPLLRAGARKVPWQSQRQVTNRPCVALCCILQLAERLQRLIYGCTVQTYSNAVQPMAVLFNLHQRRSAYSYAVQPTVIPFS